MVFAAIRKSLAGLAAFIALAASCLSWAGPNGQPMFYDGCLPDDIVSPLVGLSVPRHPVSHEYFTGNISRAWPFVSHEYGITAWRAACPLDPSRQLVMMRFAISSVPERILTKETKVVVRQAGAEIGSFTFYPSAIDSLCRGVGRGGPFLNVPIYRTPPGSLYWWDSPRKPVDYCQHMAFPIEPADRHSAFDVNAPFELTVAPGDPVDARTLRVPAASEPGNILIEGAQSGAWWNPEQPGWGLAVERNDRGVTYAVWMVYDKAGRPTWYVMLDGQPIAPNTVEGKVYRPTGPAYSGKFDAAGTGVRLGEPVGTFRIAWTHVAKDSDPARNDERGVFTFDVEGVKGTTPITRFLYHTPIGGVPTICENARGVFWNPSASGWSTAFEGGGHCPIYGAWITYGEDGSPTWFVMPNVKGGDRAAWEAAFRISAPPYRWSGDVYQPSGPRLAPVFDPAQVVVGDPVGVVSMSSLTPDLAPHSATVQLKGKFVNLGFERFRFDY